MLVVVGYFFIILPGLILTLSPTVFVYLALTAVVRRVLPLASPLAANATAFGIALLLGWAVMQPFRERELAAYRADVLPDIKPSQTIALHGNVRLEMNHRRGRPECDYLCMAILDSPKVQSVTVETAAIDNKAERTECAAYALVPVKTHPEPGLFPTEPGLLLREHPSFRHVYRGTEQIRAAKAVAASWCAASRGQ